MNRHSKALSSDSARSECLVTADAQVGSASVQRRLVRQDDDTVLLMIENTGALASETGDVAGDLVTLVVRHRHALTALIQAICTVAVDSRSRAMLKTIGAGP